LIAEGIRLVRPLGGGAMASVWLGEQQGRSVAVKIAAAEIARDEVALARFEREARLSEQMTTVHVARGYTHGVTEDGRPFMVMELLEGETFEEHLARGGRLAPSDALAILAPVAEALDEAHELGIVHRDIKPSNVFLSKRGDTLVVKVLDFGMAKRTGVAEPSVVTDAGTSVGTPDYMSPEQLRFAREVDHRSDLWALAVMAYRAIVGRLPFSSGTFAGLCMAICTGRHPRPSEIDPKLPRTLDAWFARALHLDRQRRYRTARETVATLARALEGRKSWGWIVFAALAALAIAVGALVALLRG
jgi:serine/threonine-protein kinase